MTKSYEKALRDFPIGSRVRKIYGGGRGTVTGHDPDHRRIRNTMVRWDASGWEGSTDPATLELVPRPVMTGDTVPSVAPNQPKTPQRTFRIPDALYVAAKAKADENGETLTDVVRRALEEYVR